MPTFDNTQVSSWSGGIPSQAGAIFNGYGGGGAGGIGSLLSLLSAGGLGPAAGLSFLPALLGKLGLFGKDPQAELQKKLMALQSPGNVGATTNAFNQQALASPMFAQAQSGIAAGVNQTTNNVANNLAARGIGTSGTGAILSGLTPSLAGSQMANLRSSVFQGAQGQAADSIQNQIKALLGTSGPSQNRQMAGAGINAFQPFLEAFLKQKFPTFGNMGAQP